jgi:hypothetical protein
VEEISGDGEGEGTDWGDSVIVYGIVGILELLSGSYTLCVLDCFVCSELMNIHILGSYLLVITSRSDLGHRKSSLII